MCNIKKGVVAFGLTPPEKDKSSDKEAADKSLDKLEDCPTKRLSVAAENLLRNRTPERTD